MLKSLPSQEGRTPDICDTFLLKMKSFSKKEALSFGWQIMKENFRFFVLILVLYGVIIGSFDILSVFLEMDLILEIVGIFVFLISEILGVILHLGFVKICLNFCDNLKSKVPDLFSQYRLFFRAFFAEILWFLIVLLGLFFLIIPGIYFAIRFGFFDYFIVDKKARIIESLKSSWQITKGNVWNLFLFGLLVIIINLLGLLCLIVGLLATIPTTDVATAFVYRKLLVQNEMNTKEEMDQKDKLLLQETKR